MTTIELEGRFYKLSPPGHFAGLQSIALRVELSRAALLVVDVYGLGFTKEEGAARPHPSADEGRQSSWEDIAKGAIQPALAAARRAGMPVIYTHNSGPRNVAPSDFDDPDDPRDSPGTAIAATAPLKLAE
jgi:nicotinamidase-related amidase